MIVSPMAIPPNIRARCEIDLSPGIIGVHFKATAFEDVNFMDLSYKRSTGARQASRR